MVEGILEVIVQLVSREQQQPMASTAYNNCKTSVVQFLLETRRYFLKISFFKVISIPLSPLYKKIHFM